MPLASNLHVRTILEKQGLEWEDGFWEGYEGTKPMPGWWRTLTPYEMLPYHRGFVVGRELRILEGRENP